MIKKFTIMLICLYSTLGIQNGCQVVVQVHTKCQISMKALNIINKLEQNFINQSVLDIKFTKIIHDDIYKYYETGAVKTYPAIVIKDKNGNYSYENELKLVQIQYWLNIHCLHKIPQCAAWMPQPIFPINIHGQPHGQVQAQKYLGLLNIIQKNPAIKICIDKRMPTNLQNFLPQYDSIQNTVEQLLHELPIFLKFTHNVRNHLLLNRDLTAVMFIHDRRNSQHLVAKDKFLQLMQFVRRKDTRIPFHLSQQARRSLIFVIDHLDSSMVSKLLEFVGYSKSQVYEQPAIISFRFVQHPETHQTILQSTIYGQREPVLGIKYIFWLQQVAMSMTNPLVKNKLFPERVRLQICSNYQITHYYMPNNWKSFSQNVEILSIMKAMSSGELREKYEKEIFQRIFQIAAYEQQSLTQINSDLLQSILPFNINFQQIQRRSSFYEQYKFNIYIDLIESQKVVYLQDSALKLCINGAPPMKFQNFDELFKYLKHNQMVTDKKYISSQDKKQMYELYSQIEQDEQFYYELQDL